MRIADVLRNKGASVATITPETSVAGLLTELTVHNIGAMVVVSPDGLVGIVSERDVVRKLHELGAELLRRPVSEIMTTFDDGEASSTCPRRGGRQADRDRQHRRRGEDEDGRARGPAGTAAGLHHPGALTPGAD